MLGVRWPHGVLLTGPPGCGKTLMVQAVAGEQTSGSSRDMPRSASLVCVVSGLTESPLSHI